METFSALLALFAGNSPVTDDFPAQRPVTRSFDVFFEPTVEQTMETPVIWDAIALIEVIVMANDVCTSIWVSFPRKMHCQKIRYICRSSVIDNRINVISMYK